MTRRSSRRLRALAVAVALVSSVLVPVATAPSAAAADLSCVGASAATVQKRILGEVNAARASAGLKALTESAAIDAVSMSWSAAQAKAGKMDHNPRYSSQMPSGWTRIAENVAFGYAYTKVNAAWLNSPGHRANILNSAYTHIGIGVACSSNGAAYYTQNFGAYKSNPDPLPDGITREAGDNRYETSAAVSESAFAAGVDVVYLAAGTTFPDALSGAAAAGVVGAPVLLTSKNSLPSAIKIELKRLKPKKIVVLGGQVAISSAVVKQAGAYTSGSVTRVAGANRYETSAKVSKAVFSSGADVAYLANGTTFPDALSGAAAAGTLGGPVLLVTKGSIPTVVAAELKRLKPKKIVILGGTGAVSSSVATAAAGYTSGSVSRTAGQNRYGTAAAVSEAAFDQGVKVVYVANGTTFPDALSGAAAAGTQNGPVLLTGKTSIPQDIKTELKRLKPDKIVVLGGPSAVSDSVAKALGTYVR